MIQTTAIVLLSLLAIAPPGNTKFSITPVQCHAEDCEGLKHSTFYDAYYHQETKDEGAIRYAVIVESMFEAARQELCLEQLSGEVGSKWSKIEGCTPNPKGKGWLVGELVTEAIGVTIPESGFREDVEVGRGHAHRKNDTNVDDAGGEGRGPNGESCLMQIIPSSIGQFAPDGDRSPASLLGADPEHLVRCFRTGMRMLIHARNHCDWWVAQQKQLNPNAPFAAKPTAYDRYYGMYSMYGTGDSCLSPNRGKTAVRARIAYNVDAVVNNQIRIVIKEEKAKRAGL